MTSQKTSNSHFLKQCFKEYKRNEDMILFINNIHQQKAITRKSYKSNIQRNKGIFLGIPHILTEKPSLSLPRYMIN